MTNGDANTDLKPFFPFTPAPPRFSPFLTPSLACANARPHQRIGLDYNLICSGRDGIEHQIIPNEENQSPRAQISRKLVNSDWFRHSSRQGGIWQITASQVDKEKGGEEKRGEERNVDKKKPAMEQNAEVNENSSPEKTTYSTWLCIYPSMACLHCCWWGVTVRRYGHKPSGRCWDGMWICRWPADSLTCCRCYVGKCLFTVYLPSCNKTKISKKQGGVLKASAGFTWWPCCYPAT